MVDPFITTFSLWGLKKMMLNWRLMRSLRDDGWLLQPPAGLGRGWGRIDLIGQVENDFRLLFYMWDFDTPYLARMRRMQLFGKRKYDGDDDKGKFGTVPRFLRITTPRRIWQWWLSHAPHIAFNHTHTRAWIRDVIVLKRSKLAAVGTMRMLGIASALVSCIFGVILTLY